MLRQLHFSLEKPNTLLFTLYVVCVFSVCIQVRDQPQFVFLYHIPTWFLRQGHRVHDSARLAGQKTPGILQCLSSEYGITSMDHTQNVVCDFQELNSGAHVCITISLTTEPPPQPLCQAQTSGTHLDLVGVNEWTKEWHAALTFYAGGEVCPEKCVLRCIHHPVQTRKNAIPNSQLQCHQERNLRRPLSHRLLFTEMTLCRTYLKSHPEPWARQDWEPYQNLVLNLC